MTRWIERFDGLAPVEESLQNMLLAESNFQELRAGELLFGLGKSPEYMLLLLDGTVRVQQVSKAGREIVLYRVNAGESCVLTTACLFAYEDYSAEGIAETDVEIAAVPRTIFDELIASSKPFRQFIFASYSRRITELFTVIEDIAFQRMDIRLAQLLLNLCNADGVLSTTHQQLAVELGTAREVISRQLQESQRRDWIRLARGSIELTGRQAMEKLAKNGQ